MHFWDDPWIIIVGGLLIAYCANRLIGLRERSMTLAAKRQKGDAKETASEVEDLRAELMRLRDTTTRYDLSVESALTELARRLAALEQRTGLPMPEPLPLLLPARESKSKKSAALLNVQPEAKQTVRAGRK